MIKVTTLNIGLNAVKYMVFRDASAIEWGTLPLAGAVKNCVILEPAALGEQLKPLFDSGKLSRDRVICSINGLPFSYRFFTLPKMETSAQNEALARMAKEEMPLAPEDMYLSWRAYPAEKDERQFLVTGITHRPVDALIKMAAAAGFRPYLMCLPHISLASLTNRDNAIIVDFEPDYSNITLIVQGVPVGMHTVPASGPEANLQDTTGHLIRELTRMTGFYNNNHPKNPIPETTTILLTGELSNEPETLKLIQEKTGYPVEILKQLPANTVLMPPEAPLATFGVNIGDALQDGIPHGHPSTDPALVREINLHNIIEEQSGEKKHPFSLKKVLLAAVLVIGVIAMVPAYLSQNQASAKITQLQAELKQAKQQLAQKQAASAPATQTLNNINTIMSTAQQLEQGNSKILNPRDSVNDLKFLTKSLPPASTFNTIGVSSTQININGTTSAPELVVEYVRTLETSGRFAAANIIWIDHAGGSVSNPLVSFLISIVR
jgi:Tfp pilus assembly protein PilN